MSRPLRIVLFISASWLAACGGAGVRENLLLDQELVHDGITRTYHLYEAPGDGDKPLVFTLHGGGGLIDNHIGVGLKTWPHERWLDLAETDGFYVVAPQGIDSQWNDCRSDCDHCGEQDDVGFLLALIDDLSERYPVDETRIYVSGESNGGFMTQRLAQEAPERFAAVGSVIAQMPKNNECTVDDLPIPILYQVGTGDALVPVEGGFGSFERTGEVLSLADSVAHWVDHNDCETSPTSSQIPDGPHDDASTVTLDVWDCPATSTAVHLYTMDGAGHVAPSIAYPVSRLWESAAGKQNRDIEGADVLWSFFQDYQRQP